MPIIQLNGDLATAGKIFHDYVEALFDAGKMTVTVETHVIDVIDGQDTEKSAQMTQLFMQKGGKIESVSTLMHAFQSGEHVSARRDTDKEPLENFMEVFAHGFTEKQGLRLTYLEVLTTHSSVSQPI